MITLVPDKIYTSSAKRYKIDYILRMEEVIKKHAKLKENEGDTHDNLINVSKKAIQQSIAEYNITEEEIEQRKKESRSKKKKKNRNTGNQFGVISVILGFLSIFISGFAAIRPILHFFFGFSLAEYVTIFYVGRIVPAVAVVFGILSLVRREKSRKDPIMGILFGLFGLLEVFVIGPLIVKLFPFIMLGMMFSEFW
jgi:hypothetical protein